MRSATRAARPTAAAPPRMPAACRTTGACSAWRWCRRLIPPTSGRIWIDGDTLLILTAVPKISLNYGKPDQIDLTATTADEMEKYAAQGHFAPGSMLPKVQAALRFVRSRPGRRAIISSLEQAPQALEGRAGTRITAT